MITTADAVTTHDPDNKRPYALQWSSRLASGDTLASSAWAVVSGTATIGNTSAATGATTATGTTSGTTTQVWVLSASVGIVQVRNRIVTANGEQQDQTITLEIVAQ